ncbi:RCC1/BLIP-II [Artomyces pyxidatus]|uniref:RCC1/BLIP-II n=1 Tax=Artomyces pyxidatus TaxID=48021 RepID=A0ACB8SGK4_9AGAM|nr:RCC1/BLIP-II [Artomyces pyxidatus]
MFRRPGNAVASRALRRPYSQVAGPSSRRRATVIGAGAVVAAAVVGSQLWMPSSVVYNDAPPSLNENGDPATTQKPKAFQDADGKLRLLVWGSNKTNVISPDMPGVDQIRTPAVVSFLEEVALRDLAVHASHAACVDARGDLYQWGDGFAGPSSTEQGARPTLTLQGKNLTHVQVTDSRVFALSASGRIYVMSVEASKQSLAPGSPTPSSDSWWGTGWMWGEEVGVDFSEIVPAHKLNWGEKFVSISAGRDHLLALTSTGRTFAHPITKNANSHGQLGFRKFDVPDPATTPASRLHVELTPNAVVDPYAKSSRFARLPSTSPSASSSDTPTLRPISENLTDLDDTNIRFSDKLFEIPSLKGVKVAQITAGGRSSFVRTDTGRVLGWGANEYGQIGLGGNVVLDTITIPTEVVLWRSTPSGRQTTCVDVSAGGDLVFFTVERKDGSSIETIDLLSCGNGQYGGLGNALFSNAQSVPVRTKSVSGLLEFSEKSNNLQPIAPHAVAVSPDGHVLLTLDTLTHAGPGGGGKDVFVWGTNYEYQLGNGKRTSAAVPATLEGTDGVRFMLMQKKADVVKDPRGRVWKRGVEVEQVAVAGYGNSLVYWRICA